MRRSTLLSALTAFTALAGCPSNGDVKPPPGRDDATSLVGADVTEPVRAPTLPDDFRGLVLSLASAPLATARAEQPPLAAARPLSEAEGRALLARLPPLPVAAVARPQPVGELAPPAAKKMAAGPTLPPPTAHAAPEGPPVVVRAQPLGETRGASHVSVTFSEPMVAEGAATSGETASPPITLAPAVAGTWRWVGRGTVMFEPARAHGQRRLPMATVYDVSVPAGTASARGVATAEAHTWRFATPPPGLVVGWPEATQAAIDTPIFVGFDQRVAPDAVAERLSVEAGGRPVPHERVSADEVRSHPDIADLARAAGPDRWVAVRPRAPLPAGTTVTVTVPPGTPSAEGPLETTEAQRFAFDTHPRPRVLRHRCGWGGACEPGMPWSIELSAPLDADAFDPATMVRVDPPVPSLEIAAAERWLTLTGRPAGRTRYTVTLDASLRDAHGQPLGQDATLTFDVGAAPPSLSAAPGPMVVLDPAARATLPVSSVGHPRLRARLYRVGPDDWDAWLAYLRAHPGEQANRSPPGELVSDDTLVVTADQDAASLIEVDVAPALTGGRGQVIVHVEPADQPAAWSEQQHVIRWVQATGLALDAAVDGRRLIGRVTELATGRPAAAVDVALAPTGRVQRSDGDGLVRFDLPARTSAQRNLLVATRGDDRALLPDSWTYWGDGGAWHARPAPDALRWFVTGDRSTYRPGETARLKGWLRVATAGPGGGVGAAPDAVSVRWTLRSPAGARIDRGSARVDAAGGFDVALRLPDDMALGWATVDLTAEGGGALEGRGFAHGFQVQVYQPPAIEVVVEAGADSASPNPARGALALATHGHASSSAASPSSDSVIIGERAVMAARATRPAGDGGLDGAAVRAAPLSWSVRSEPVFFAPPNHAAFAFGDHQPWWSPRPVEAGAGRAVTFDALTDATGRHALRLDLEAVRPARPMQVTATATVTDTTREAGSGAATLLVHPSRLYVGVRPRKNFVDAGAAFEVELVVSDVDGRRVPGVSVAARAERLVWRRVARRWVERPAEARECEVESQSAPVRCRFEADGGGRWRVTARVEDEAGRPGESEVSVWVGGGDGAPAELAEERVGLVPDEATYAPGDVAQILVRAPFPDAHGLLTLRRDGILDARPFAMKGHTHTLSVPIDSEHVPNLHLRVDLVGEAARVGSGGEVVKGAPPRPAYASGELDLPIPPAERALTVTVAPREATLAPGGETLVALRVVGADGRPVAGADATVVVVDDEAVGSTLDALGDPLGAFYAERPAGVEDVRMRDVVALAPPGALPGPAPAGEGARGGTALDPQTLKPPALRAADAPAEAERRATPGGVGPRSRGGHLALFAPSLRTDAEGRASVALALPDVAARWRIVALASDGARRFGRGEGTLRSRAALSVRAAPPRFLRAGDGFQLPLLVANEGDEAVTARLAARATGAELTDAEGVEIEVPARGRVEVRVSGIAGPPGTMRLQAGMAAGGAWQALDVVVPVIEPAGTEALAVHGAVERGAIGVPVAVPEGARADVGGLSVSVSASRGQVLAEAVRGLLESRASAPGERASRVIVLSALRGRLATMGGAVPSDAAVASAVRADLEALRGMQNRDGGFGLWGGGGPSQAWVSVHAAHALARARDAGFEVADAMVERAKLFGARVERAIPAEAAATARHTIAAYALYARERLGDRDVEAALALAQVPPRELGPEALAFLIDVLSRHRKARATLRRLHEALAARVEQADGGAGIPVAYGEAGDWLLLGSGARAAAVALEALIEDAPRSALSPGLAEGLFAAVAGGRETSQALAFALPSLGDWLDAVEGRRADVSGRVWVGERLWVDAVWKGRGTEASSIEVPVRELVGQGTQVAVQARGREPLWWRVGLRWAPREARTAPVDEGFVVERRYEAVDAPGDVRRGDDGAWRVAARAAVRVRLAVVASGRRAHVALVDHLPAGFEVVDAERAVIGPGEAAPLPGTWRRAYGWAGPWWDQARHGDERVEAFAGLLDGGVYEYVYIARAVTPGTFVAPAATADELYGPARGASASARVIVE